MCLWFPQPHLSHRVITSRIMLSPFVVFFCNIVPKMAGLKICNNFSINSLCLGSWYMEQINAITLNMTSKALTTTPLPFFHHLGATRPFAFHHGAVYISQQGKCVMRPSISFILRQQLCAEGLHCAIHCTQSTPAQCRETSQQVWFCIVLWHNVTMANMDMSLSANRNTSNINTDSSMCTVILAWNDNGMYE